MARGRRPISDEIKQLKGSRIRRKLLLDAASNVAEPAAADIPVPDFLTHPRERAIFREAAELMRWVTSTPDFAGLARWSSYLHLWLAAKEKLAGRLTYTTVSKHGSLRRKNPQFQAMCDLERMLLALENTLGLNPQARRHIGLRFSAAVFVGEPDEEKSEISPIGFLNRH